MSSRKTSLTYLLVFSVTVVIVVSALTLLPHDKALRYARLTDDFSKAGWIYHRTHDDPRDIDVAFLGTSHTMAAVDERALEHALGDNLDDVPALVNYALPSHGRNLHYAFAKDLFTHKRPQLLVLEIRETEGRFGHPLFRLVADPADILAPVMLINGKAAFDAASLPLRQAALSVETRIRQSDIDALAKPLWVPDYVQGRKSEAMASDALYEASARYKAKKRWNMLGESLDWLEYRYPREYLKRIVALAREHNCELAFLYLPFFGADPVHRDEAMYLEWGELWYPPASILDDPRNWSDVTHINERGSQQLIPWLDERVAAHFHGRGMAEVSTVSESTLW